MADNLTSEQRSYNMSRIRSRGNSSTEQALIAVMRTAGIRGWRRKSKLCGKPDFVFPRFNTVVFVDGCYWHGCRKCGLGAKTNNEYWGPKISGNAKRDRRNTRELRAAGWKVIRIWEHELKAAPMKCIRKIMIAIGPEEL
ncbi:MAG: very short patch repair endonuclease [Acidobacteriia bacterium]|nr:very short patch repair endonuclease [Terriglobia bacterium]